MSNRIKTRNTNPKFTTQTQNTNVTSVRHSRCLCLMSDNQTIQKLVISHKQFVKYYNFNPIHVATKRELVGLLQQSIPFHVDLVYILVHFSKFSLINFVVLSAEKSSSLHIIYFKNHKQTKHLIILIFNQVYFPFH